MKRSVQDAISTVRAQYASRLFARPGPVWDVARLLADEVERVHAELEKVKAKATRLEEQVSSLVGS